MENDSAAPHIRLYRRVDPEGRPAGQEGDGLIAKFRVFLPDRPGSLAAFASAIASANGNISFFHYDRSVDSSRVAVEVQIADRRDLDHLLSSVRESGFAFDRAAPSGEDLQITSMESVLELKARLENRPGTLAAFARLLAGHHANVIYMLYDEDIDPVSADIAMATADPAEVGVLLQAMNGAGYHYRVLYQGAAEQEVSRVIGLNLVEKFFLRLKKLLPTSDLQDIRSLVESSRDLHQDLVSFYTEAGNDLGAADVFETVLTFASRSRGRTGDKFAALAMPPVRLAGGVELLGFRLPTSENIYVLRNGKELSLVDTGHGIYYEDLKRHFRDLGLDPANVSRIFVTHPDTDHAGAAGYFEQEFGTAVFLHRGSIDVIRNENRAWGASGSLLNLNKYYTKLSSRFTECRFPEKPVYFREDDLGETGGFRIIDRFTIGPLRFDVLEGRGGHTPGLVFFLCPDGGLLFTSDFLINVQSLMPDEKEHLGIYRTLLTSPNRDNALYKEESEGMKRIALELLEKLAPQERDVLICPGHGEYYSASRFRE